MSAQEQAVLSANQSFYQAFSKKDLEGMRQLWADDLEIAVIHPGWPPLLGYESVTGSWKRIFEGGMSPEISCVDAKTNIIGEVAVVICTEILAETELVATNIFVLKQEHWKMIHHQAGPLPALGNGTEGDVLH